jgi:HlyD family secretion protein
MFLHLTDEVPEYNLLSTQWYSSFNQPMSWTGNSSGFWNRNRWLLWTAGVVVGVVLFASFMSRGEVVPVRAGVAQRTTIRSVVSTNGKVEPVVNFEAHAPVGTTVKKLLVREGEHVKQGQLLLQMNDVEARSEAARAMSQMRSAQADLGAVQSGGNREELLTLDSNLAKARTARNTAQRNLEALQRLQKDGAASPGEVKAAEDQLQRANADVTLLEQKQKGRYSSPEIARVEAQKSEAQAAYEAAEDALRQLNVRAPFSGIVYSLPVLEGAYVNPGDLVLQEADLSKVRVRAFVDEPDVGRLVGGDPIEITWDALPGRIWHSRVTLIPALIKLHGTRNVGETTCVVDNPDLKLLPNVNVGVTIVTAEHHDVLTVPREAVHQEDSRTYVYQIQNDELSRRDVQTSISNLTQVEVTGGLPDNALVALAPLNSKPLRNALAVRVVH